jgi:hypothetical protein
MQTALNNEVWDFQEHSEAPALLHDSTSAEAQQIEKLIETYERRSAS